MNSNNIDDITHKNRLPMLEPLLEFASPVCSLPFIKDTDAIEKVQRRFTKSFPNLRDLPYPIRSSEYFPSQ